MPFLGKTLLTLVSLTTSTGCYLADWNETHIHNARWPPHAKFHNGQTMSMGLLLGAICLFYTHRPGRSAEVKRHFLDVVSWVGALYWVTQLSAFFYPGTLATDPEFGEGMPQVYISGVLLVLLAVGVRVERGAIASGEHAGKRE